MADASAAGVDPSTGLPLPILTPEAYPNLLDVQRKQMLARALLGASQGAAQTPENWNSMRVVPRMGIAQPLASLTGALLGGRALRSAQDAEMGYFGKLYGEGGADGPAASGGSASAPGGAAAPAPSAPGAAGASAGTSGNPAGIPQGNPMIPAGMPRGTAQQLLGLMGPAEYAKTFIAPNYTPTELQREMRASGIEPTSPLGRALARLALQKGVQNVQDVRPGGTIFDLNTGQPVFTGPQNGTQTTWDETGVPHASNVEGAPEAAAAMRGAEKGAEVANTPVLSPKPGGGSELQYPGQVRGLGPPPALTRFQEPANLSGNASAASPPLTPPNTGNAASPSQGFWQGAPTASAPNVPGGPGVRTTELEEGYGKEQLELQNKYAEAAKLANQQLEYNREAMRALPNAETGPLSDWLTKSRAALIQLGVPSSLIPSSGTVVPTLELNKALKNAALQGARGIYGPRMTQTEVKLQTDEMSPSSSMMRDAIASLIQQNNVRSLYALKQSQDYQRYLQLHPQDANPGAFENYYETHRGLPEFAAMASMDPAKRQTALQRFAQHPESRAEFKSKLGFDPLNWRD